MSLKAVGRTKGEGFSPFWGGVYTSTFSSPQAYWSKKRGTMRLYPHLPPENGAEHREIIDELDDETEEALREFLAKRKEQIEGRRENNPEFSKKSKSGRNQKN